MEAGPLKRRMAMQEKLEKITVRLCWSILMVGLGYAWAYHHWMSLAESDLIALAAVKGLAL